MLAYVANSTGSDADHNFRFRGLRRCLKCSCFTAIDDSLDEPRRFSGFYRHQSRATAAKLTELRFLEVSGFRWKDFDSMGSCHNCAVLGKVLELPATSPSSCQRASGQRTSFGSETMRKGCQVGTERYLLRSDEGTEFERTNSPLDGISRLKGMASTLLKARLSKLNQHLLRTLIRTSSKVVHLNTLWNSR